jgi:uncharacterized protein YdbL (DUF1318 family)
MFPIQNTATKLIVANTSTATNATTSGLVDVLGFDSVGVDVMLDSQAATSSNPAQLTLQECDTSDGTYANITGLVGDATDGFTIPIADSEAAQIIRLNVDCRARKRYLKVLIQPAGTTQIVGATAVCGKAGDSTVARALMATVVDV